MECYLPKICSDQKCQTKNEKKDHFIDEYDCGIKIENDSNNNDQPKKIKLDECVTTKDKSTAPVRNLPAPKKNVIKTYNYSVTIIQNYVLMLQIKLVFIIIFIR